MEKIQSADFTLTWENQLTGQKFVTQYYYSRKLHGMSFKGYKLRCISFGKKEGLKYIPTK